ncbi:MAG: diadenylate cyclase CdaA [Oscillospiraceae bacterium]|nr:diadenylate cyclase CdaA [Oscillospiraceae bacterium]
MTILQTLQSAFSNIGAVFADFRFNDFLDICFVAFLIYNVIKLIRETRTGQLVKGLVLLGVVYFLVTILGMQATGYLFSALFRDVILVLIVVFQPEIRHIIEAVGRSKIKGLSGIHARNAQIRYNEETTVMIGEICKACAEMSDRKIGALIVLEKETPLNEVIETGTPVDAKISEELLGNVFYPKAPLHDGAAVIRENRLCAAGCILPLTQHHGAVSSALGTRHRAAIGMSEQSDAVMVVVSEETGYISVAKDGRLRRNISDGELREVLCDELLLKETEETTSALKNLLGRKHK